MLSMTGHGGARSEGDGFELQVEVRSVNNRHLRIVTKISDEVSHLQPALEEVVRKRVTRGTVFATVRLTPTRRTEFYQVDEDVLREYHARIGALARELDTGETILLKDLLLLPGAIQTEETLPENDAFLAAATQSLSAALDALNVMRSTEGEHLQGEFRGRVYDSIIKGKNSRLAK